MGTLLFWIFLLFPVAEVYVLIKVGARIGFWDTLFLLIFSAILGSYLAKMQGKIALQRIQACLVEGRMPTVEMMDGVLIFIGGLLFVIPGFLSDVLGVILIFPPTRFVVRVLILGSMKGRVSAPNPSGMSSGAASVSTRKPVGRDDVEDAQIVE